MTTQEAVIKLFRRVYPPVDFKNQAELRWIIRFTIVLFREGVPPGEIVDLLLTRDDAEIALWPLVTALRMEGDEDVCVPIIVKEIAQDICDEFHNRTPVYCKGC